MSPAPPNPESVPVDATRAELERKLRFFETFFYHAGDLIYVIDLEHRFVYANRMLIEVWGIPWAEAEGKNFHELSYEPWLADFLSEEVDAVAATGMARRGEVPYTGTPGLRQYEYVFSPIFGENGAVEAISGITRDITERKDAEMVAAVINELSERLSSIREENEIIRVATEAVGTKLNCDRCYFVECFEAEDRIVVSENWTREGTAPLAGTFRLFDYGGAEWWHQYASGDFMVEEVAGHALTAPKKAAYDALGVVAYMTQPFKRDGKRTVVMGATDNVPRKWTPGQLRLLENVVARVWPLVEQAREARLRVKLLEDLRTIDRRKDHFLATLAHELRNPLAPILTGIAVIENSQENPELIGRVSTMIHRQVRFMVDLIDDLLEISRIKTGKIVLKKTIHPLSELLKQAVDNSAPGIAENGHELQVTGPAEEPIWVEVDASRLVQIISNLLSNAARYTSHGGKIALRAEVADKDIRLIVTDNGHGIERSEHESIFELFHQSQIGEEQGLGIGLALVKTLVELHDGTVSVRSEGKDKGSEFIVHLRGCVVEGDPHDTPARSDGDSASAGVGTECAKVLVVDDGQSAADILAMFFEMEGKEVAVAYDGLSAVEKVKHFAPDLVVMDLGMPVMDGFEAASRIREFRPDIRLVALSGWGRGEDRERATEAGFHHFLVKPVNPDDLRTLLSEIC